MSHSIDEFIKSNRDKFNDKEPSEKVWKAIENTLQQMNQGSFWNSLTVWRAAALAFFCLSLYLFAKTPNSSSKTTLTQQNEFTDLESFYANQIAEKTELINHFEPADEEQFTQDFQKLDAMYQVLREEMKSRPSAKVKDALVLNLLVRIDLLNQQIKKLEERKSRTTVGSSI
jgi:hypothetical protein